MLSARPRTNPVTRITPINPKIFSNPFGLYDVHGNVWEWVQDCWLPSHEGAPSDGTARLSGTCKYRTTRSGSWYYVSTNVRSTYRARFNPRAFSYGIGLRVLREQP